MPGALIRTAYKIYISLVSLSTAAPLPEVNNICSTECLMAPQLLLTALLISNFNVNTVVGAGCRHQ